MNKKQRERLPTAIDVLREIADEERDKVESAPENLAQTDQYVRMEECADAIDSATAELDEYAS